MNAIFKKIVVVGLGYIGLPTAAMLASRGVQVVGVDIDENIVATINSGKVHIVEPDLDVLVHDVVASKHLYATTYPEPADAFLITVPTPFKKDHQPDLSYVEAAALSIAPVLTKGNLIILESTSPVGTTELITKQLAQLRSDLCFPQSQNSKPADIYIAYCPERVMPGQIIRELVENDRIIGGITDKCTTKAKAFYTIFVQGECFITDSRTAEMAKLTENSFRDVNIAFANELSMICDQFNIDVSELISLANRHPRVNILQPGPGVGGHCIAVDPWFIVSAAPNESKLIRAAREVNDSKPAFVIQKILTAAANFSQPKIACLGLAYKANTDDLRESPVIKIIQALPQYQINIVEPNISKLPNSLTSPCYQLVSLDEGISQSDIIVLMVNHKEFKTLNLKKLEKKIYINAAHVGNIEEAVVFASARNPSRPVSDFGLMMMDRIYGQIFS